MGGVKIGVVCLARDTFDYGAAGKLYGEQRQKLSQMAGVEWFFQEGVTITPEEARGTALWLAENHVDGVVIISGTFHLGHLALIIDDAVKKPVLLWAFGELPYNGGKIRLNSVCGVNLDASNLYKAGNDNYVCCMGDEIDAEWVAALRMKAALSGAHVGIAGYRAHGFFNLSAEDLCEYRNFGVLVDHYELAALMRPREKNYAGEVMQTYDCSRVTPEQVDKVGALAAGMEAFLDENKLDALAVRCWPEFAAAYGIAPCAAMSFLQAKGRVLGCEGDLEGTLSLLAAKAAVGATPFLADLSQVDTGRDFALMWHCGVAAPDLWDGKSEKTLDTYFAGGKGVTADFVMKEGSVTVMRIDTARDKTRVFLAGGRALPMAKELKGTYAKVRFEKNAAKLLDTVTTTGVAHHVAMVYGSCAGVFRKFARLCGFEVIE
jgi:L-fucose isomerase-like protein